MSTEQNTNEVTDRTNDIPENVVACDQVKIVVNDPIVPATSTRNNYEVVFFARYKINPRPSAEDVTSFFNKYGVVHHVNCPEGRNFAFIFMTSLSTPVEHRRTRTTISQIIHEMTPETRFHITVASSTMGSRPESYPSQYNNSYPNQYNNSYPNQSRQYSTYDNRQPRNHDRSLPLTDGRYPRNAPSQYQDRRYPRNAPVQYHNDVPTENRVPRPRQYTPGTYQTTEATFTRTTTRAPRTQQRSTQSTQPARATQN